MTNMKYAGRQRDQVHSEGPTGVRTLADLPPGSRATVIRIVAPAPATAARLADLGFTPGTPVQVVRRAPLRDPVIYRVKDYELCLRRAQAAWVHVEADQ